MTLKYNKGEWSELYAFIKLLKEGRIYAADQNANRIQDQYLPIIKIIRREKSDQPIDYYTGQAIKMYQNGVLIAELLPEDFDENIKMLFDTIFVGSPGEGAFEIPGIQSFMNKLQVAKAKANSLEKVDMEMQIHDFHTGFSPEVGFSIKSDIGSAPTLLNPGKNTRFRYRILGLSDDSMALINKIDKTANREYMKERFGELISKSSSIVFDQVLDQTYEDNLILIDSDLPKIYGNMILEHYLHIKEGIYNCTELIDLVAQKNPLNYRRIDFYSIKFKKLITASALGMTPGKKWDGKEAATGGYIIIKRDGDVLCFHLYNRNFFEEYLLNNTRLDRPSASRYDYGYIYKIGENMYIDLNVQIRFKTIG